jgi:hypothetical protein
VDETDFKTPETALTIANTDIKLIVNGAASVNKNSGGGTHRANGVYGVTFDATDTATVGEIEVSVNVAGALIVFDKFAVLEEVVYDALFAAAAPGYLQPTTAGRTLDVSATGEAGLDWANIGSPTTAQNLSATNIDVDQIIASVSGAVGSVTGAVGSVTGAVGSVAAGGITAASIATDAIDADALAADAITEIQAGLSTAAALATVQADTDDIQTRLPAALSAGGNIKADVLSLGGVVQSLTDLKDFADDGYDPATNKVQGVVLVDTLTTYTGNTVQTGDSFARIGVAGAGLTNIDLPNQTMDITGNLSGSVGSVTGAVGSVTGAVGSVAAGGITAASIATDAIDADALAASAITEIQAGLSTAAALATVQADTDDIQARLPAALTAGGFIKADAVAWNALTTVALPLVPTVAGRTLDVSATGEGGVDWANVGSQNTAVTLANTTISTAQKVDVETIKTNPVVNAGTITFPTTATLASTTNITAGTITTTTNLTTNNDKTGYAIGVGGIASTAFAAGAIDAASLSADAGLEIADAVHDEVVDGVITHRQSIRLLNSASGAKLSGAGTATVFIRDLGDTKDRVTATVDASGNRSAVTRDLT